jgi:hypothetical protein
VTNSTDCDDTEASVHPNATETCNGIDDDCDNSTDEGVQNTYYHDSDGDGYGDAGDSTQACSAPANHVADSTDCNDNDGSIHPNATETCNGVDDNCSDEIDEGLSRPTTCGVGECAGNTGNETCTAGQWGNDTCDPYAGATQEVCDNEDNDCDGSTDEIFTDLGTECTNGEGACQQSGVMVCASDQQGTVCNAVPGTPSDEVCYDGIDDDCNGEIDDRCSVIYPTSSFTARLISEQNVLVGDASGHEGEAFNSSYVFIKEGTSDRGCLEFYIGSQSTASRVTLHVRMRNIDNPQTSMIELYDYRANGLANASDYYIDDDHDYMTEFSDDGDSGYHWQTIDITNTYNDNINLERAYMGILLKTERTNEWNARYDIWQGATSRYLTLSY